MSANKLCRPEIPETKQFFCFVGLVCLEEVCSSVFLTTVVHERTHFTHMANISLRAGVEVEWRCMVKIALVLDIGIFFKQS